jgi:hypothetical protein
MEARVTTIWLPPSRLAEAVRFVREEVAPALAPQPGCAGIWLFADRDAGRLLSVGLWETRAALTATDFLYQELREKVGRLYGGPPVAERYVARPPEQGLYAVRAAPARPEAAAGARVARVTTLRGAPDRVEGLVGQLEAQIAPVLERQRGYLGLYLLVDGESGTARAVGLWASAEALGASDAAVAPLRQQAAAALGASDAPAVAVYEVAAWVAPVAGGEGTT